MRPRSYGISRVCVCQCVRVSVSVRRCVCRCTVCMCACVFEREYIYAYVFVSVCYVLCSLVGVLLQADQCVCACACVCVMCRSVNLRAITGMDPRMCIKLAASGKAFVAVFALETTLTGVNEFMGTNMSSLYNYTITAYSSP